MLYSCVSLDVFNALFHQSIVGVGGEVNNKGKETWGLYTGIICCWSCVAHINIWIRWRTFGQRCISWIRIMRCQWRAPGKDCIPNWWCNCEVTWWWSCSWRFNNIKHVTKEWYWSVGAFIHLLGPVINIYYIYLGYTIWEISLTFVSAVMCILCRFLLTLVWASLQLYQKIKLSICMFLERALVSMHSSCGNVVSQILIFPIVLRI